jgi:hypothetical protein
MKQKIAFAPRQDQPQYETLIVEDDIEEGAVQAEATVVVVQKAELPELIHEETDTGARVTIHLGEHVLTDLRNDRLRLTFFPKMGQ